MRPERREVGAFAEVRRERVRRGARHARRARQDAVAGQHVRPEHAALMVGRVEVVRRLGHDHALAPQRLDGLAHEARVAEVRGDRDDHGRAGVRREPPRLGEVVGAVERLGAGLDRQDHAAGADTRAFEAVVRLRGRLPHLVVGVAVGAVVRRGVVLVVVEVPPGDVVDVAVVVVVLAVRERDDQVLGVEVAVAVRVVHARVVRIVLDVEHAVVVGVVGRRPVRQRELALVQVDLVDEVAGVGRVPVDAALDVRDDRVGTPRRVVAPRRVGRHAGGVLRVVRGRLRALRDERVQVVLVLVDGVRQAVRRAALGRRVARVVGRGLREVGQRDPRPRDDRRDDGEHDDERAHPCHVPPP